MNDLAKDGIAERRGALPIEVVLVIGVLLAARLLYAAFVPLDLVHDEAYYWDWSRNLDYGYYSKPPMIAWLIAAGTAIAGDSSFGVRLPAVVLGTCGLVWVYLLGRRMFSHRVGMWAMVLSAATPGNTALSLLMTIDAPLLFCWSASLYAFWRFLERGPDRLLWMLTGTLTVGLGILSKQTMIGFLALGGVFVLVSGTDRRELRSPALWIWGLVSLAFLTPVVVWNYQHDWITVQHTGEHFSTETVPLAKRLARSGEFLATQLGVVAPLTWLLVVGVLAAAAMAFRNLSRQAWFLLCFSGLPLAGVFALSLRQRVEPNWPAAFYPAAVVLLVAWLLGMVQFSPHTLPRPRIRLLRNAAIAGIVASLLVYLMPFGLGMLGLQGSKLDPAVRLRGWRQLGAEVGRRIQPLAHDEYPLVVVTTGRAVASELAFYLPARPRVYVWNAGGQVTSQYDIWGGPRDQQGNDAVIVTHQHHTVPPEVAASFDHVEPLELVTVDIGNGRRHAFQLWRGVGLLQDGQWDMRSIAARRGMKGDKPGDSERIATQPAEEKPVNR